MTPSAGISDIGSSGSGRVSEDTVMHTRDGLDLSTQARYQGNALPGNFITSSQLHPFEIC